MDPADLVDLVSRGLVHDADRALGELSATVGTDIDEDAAAAAVFLRILACRFDDALDTAHALTSSGVALGPLAVAAVELAVAVCAGEVSEHPGGLVAGGPLGGLTAMLQVEAAMSSGLIASARHIATAQVPDGSIDSPFAAWSAIALARAWAFEGQLGRADVLVDRVVAAPAVASWPQMRLLAHGARIFLDGHLGRVDAVTAGLAELGRLCPTVAEHEHEHDYVFAGAHVLAAFGANAIGLLPVASALVLRGGGGEHLPRLQVVDRLYAYEILVEDALSRGDVAAAHAWTEHGAGLPVDGHHMAGAALGRIKARVAIAQQDAASGIRESAGSGALASLVGSDLEVIRARIIEASARVASGDRIRGIDELEEVARRADAAGAAAVKVWAEGELRRHGRRLRNVPGHGWDELTAPQQAVARLAAAGLRNREIAAALWVSDKTVESHVAVVLEALGTTNRVGIGRELGGAGVDPLFGDDLTVRQREVALLVADGHSNGEISTTLGISEKTVEKHVASLFERLHVRTRAAVAARVRGSTSASSTAH